jgi:hypothetical protein
LGGVGRLNVIRLTLSGKVVNQSRDA